MTKQTHRLRRLAIVGVPLVAAAGASTSDRPILDRRLRPSLQRPHGAAGRLGSGIRQLVTKRDKGGNMTTKGQALRRVVIVGAMLMSPTVSASFAAEPAFADPQSHLLVRDGKIVSGISSPTATQSARVPEIVAGLGPRVAGAAVATSSPRVGRAVLANPGPSPSSFDWGAAGIGAGGAVGLTLLVGGTAFVLRRRRQAAPPPTPALD